MDKLDLIKDLSITNNTKMVMLVLDGLGGMALEAGGKTELETANTPNLDLLAESAALGMTDPIMTGITPGSGPAHLGLFGYDPIKYSIGRGALAGAGIGFNMQENDLAARINFATYDNNGLITDRRAGRITTDESSKLCELLDKIEISNVKVFVKPVKEHRAVVIFRGPGLSDKLSDSDPQKTGVQSKEVVALDESTKTTAILVNKFIHKTQNILADKHPANTILLRGFARKPELPQMKDVYKLNAAAIAGYPMYKGLAQFVGMEILQTGGNIREEFETLRTNFSRFDFFFIHIKATDSFGEDGNFDKKVKVIEEVDRNLALITDLKPDVLVITGDHSTPAFLKSHSWHPVPFLLHSKYCRPDDVGHFGETSCLKGALGRFPALDIMPLMMANSLRLTKYGA
ncbi:MAG: 2,3-bisphosphoglycerate-independent phosphoglycerate mutase [bacterium]|nr:2,3-bisphosphoglycerate-independent phosphoglycerate mutase [bacterium]